MKTYINPNTQIIEIQGTAVIMDGSSTPTPPVGPSSFFEFDDGVKNGVDAR